MHASIQKFNLEGAYLIKTNPLGDERGGFVKTVHEGFFEEHGLDCSIREQYYSYSQKYVLRGMHFQVPPSDHVKVVYCIEGEVLDVILDIRKYSPTFGMTESVRLKGRSGDTLYIPKGMAHGFLTISDEAIMVYNVSSVYDPDHDRGVLWSSFGFPWPVTDPLLSDRDRNHPELSGFQSPF